MNSCKGGHDTGKREREVDRRGGRGRELLRRSCGGFSDDDDGAGADADAVAAAARRDAQLELDMSRGAILGCVCACGGYITGLTVGRGGKEI